MQPPFPIRRNYISIHNTYLNAKFTLHCILLLKSSIRLKRRDVSSSIPLPCLFSAGGALSAWQRTPDASDIARRAPKAPDRLLDSLTGRRRPPALGFSSAYWENVPHTDVWLASVITFALLLVLRYMYLYTSVRRFFICRRLYHNKLNKAKIFK